VGISASLFESAGVIVPSRRGYKPAKKKPAAPIEWDALSEGSILLAIDPASAAAGWALMEKTERDPKLIFSGVIRPAGREELGKMDDLAKQVHELATRTFRLNGFDYKPTDAVVEMPFGAGKGFSNPRALNVYARAVGVCEAACSLAGLSMNRIEPASWKSSMMAGIRKRDAQKRRSMFLAKSLFGITPIDDNHSDAMLIGYFLCMR